MQKNAKKQPFDCYKSRRINAIKGHWFATLAFTLHTNSRFTEKRWFYSTATFVRSELDSGPRRMNHNLLLSCIKICMLLLYNVFLQFLKRKSNWRNNIFAHQLGPKMLVIWSLSYESGTVHSTIVRRCFLSLIKIHEGLCAQCYTQLNRPSPAACINKKSYVWNLQKTITDSWDNRNSHKKTQHSEDAHFLNRKRKGGRCEVHKAPIASSKSEALSPFAMMESGEQDDRLAIVQNEEGKSDLWILMIVIVLCLKMSSQSCCYMPFMTMVSWL